MKNRMLSKRVYFTVSSLMMLVLFMFQFSGIIRKKYNNFDENKYAVSEKNDLNNNNVFTVLTDEDILYTLEILIQRQEIQYTSGVIILSGISLYTKQSHNITDIMRNIPMPFL